MRRSTTRIQDDTDNTDTSVTVAVAIAPEAATEAPEQEDDEDDDKYESNRHDLSPVTTPNQTFVASDCEALVWHFPDDTLRVPSFSSMRRRGGLDRLSTTRRPYIRPLGLWNEAFGFQGPFWGARLQPKNRVSWETETHGREIRFECDVTARQDRVSGAGVTI
jgi:hypothetical protein